MLQAKGYELQSYTKSARRFTDPDQDPDFPYGWRYVKKWSSTGEEIYDRIPLTESDILNPQEGDQMPQRNEHSQVIVDLVSILRHHYAKTPTMGVYTDLIMDWGIPDLANPSPDIAIVPNVKQRDVVGGTFKVSNEGTHPCLVMEVMSPWYPGDDTKKVEIYAKAGIPEYFLIKPRLEHGAPRYELSGYRLQDGVYHSLFPSSSPWGRVLISQTLQLQFEVVDQGRQVKVTDLQTGKPLLTLSEVEATLQQEQAARLVAEAAQQQERAARQQEQVARLAAEARVEAEAKARAELEARLQELEKLLKSRS